MKLYTEEQVKKAIAMGYDWCHQKHIPDDLMIENFIKSLTPIELPSDEEISKWAEIQSLGEPTGAEEFGRIYGAKWMRDKIQGGNK